MGRKLHKIVASLFAIATATAANAQLLPPDDLLVRFSRFETVRERQIPGFEAPGVPIGTFTLSPNITGSANYSDNIFAQRDARVSDTFFRVEPTAILQSNWSQRSLTLSANGRFDRYANQTSENVDAVSASAYGVQQFGDSTRLRLVARYQNDRESREGQTVFALTQRPVHYENESVALGVSQRFASVLVSGEAGYDRFNFDDARLRNGPVIDEDFRDRDTYNLRLRAEIAQSPSLAYFVQGLREATNYDRPDGGTGNLRGNTRYQVLGGARFELPLGARGEIGVGYVNSQSEGARYRTFSGLALSSRVTLFPTELTTVNVSLQRSVNDAGVPNSTGYLVTSGTVQVDHELLRNLILGANIGYETDNFNGIDRRDRRLTAGATAEYKLGRAFWIRFGYDFIDLSSRGVDQFRAFDRNRATFAIRYRV
ncbi:outer membrane beta-barrel protein [Glacieibacterium sp.]|uniref:outer membrane beta-barrel protein n=1 Tax=Glacieibacterium sp. TaxID=2860237 RepID=UPI003AFFFAE5